MPSTNNLTASSSKSVSYLSTGLNKLISAGSRKLSMIKRGVIGATTGSRKGRDQRHRRHRRSKTSIDVSSSDEDYFDQAIEGDGSSMNLAQHMRRMSVDGGKMAYSSDLDEEEDGFGNISKEEHAGDHLKHSPSTTIAVMDTLQAVKVADMIGENHLEAAIEYTRDVLHMNPIEYKTPFGGLIHLCIMMSNSTEMLRRLLSLGYDINNRNDADGSTPLHIAARLGKSEMLEVLLGAEDSIDDSLRDFQGRLAIDVAKNKQISNLIECTI